MIMDFLSRPPRWRWACPRTVSAAWAPRTGRTATGPTASGLATVRCTAAVSIPVAVAVRSTAIAECCSGTGWAPGPGTGPAVCTRPGASTGPGARTAAWAGARTAAWPGARTAPAALGARIAAGPGARTAAAGGRPAAAAPRRRWTPETACRPRWPGRCRTACRTADC